MGRIEMALRERLEQAGCYPVDRGEEGKETWFSPHLNRDFALPGAVTTPAEANAVLRSAGMEEAF